MVKHIIVAESQGFCWGVRRALKIVARHEKVSILGDLIHNKQVVARLESQGKKVIHQVRGDEKEPIVITAHGIDESQLNGLTKLGLEVVDTTCPLVSVIYQAGLKLEAAGYQIVIIGDRNHIEVKGIASRMQRPIIINDEDELSRVTLPDRVGVICQSTFSEKNFDLLVDRIKVIVKEVEVKNTICSPTNKRQEAAEKLAGQVDVMVVIGGFHSSNTKKLASMASRVVETHHVETDQDLDPGWFEDKEEVGIIAGASTPDWIIKDVCSVIEGFDSGNKEP